MDDELPPRPAGSRRPLPPPPERRWARPAIARERRRPAVGATRSPVLTVGLIVLLGIVSVAVSSGGSNFRSGAPLAAMLGDTGYPTPSRSTSQQPLGTPMTVSETGPYAFINVQPDSGVPVSYDPCRPLHYVVNDAMAPPGSGGLVNEAVAAIEQVTGLQFELEGDTDEAANIDRPAFLPERYGDRWAPILIAWSDPTQIPALDGDVAGVGGSTAATTPSGERVYVSGIAFLDAPQMAERLASIEGRVRVRAVIFHELAHVVGLGHVADPTQLMHESSPVTKPQAGDLAGLVQLGAGPCVPEL